VHPVKDGIRGIFLEKTAHIKKSCVWVGNLVGSKEHRHVFKKIEKEGGPREKKGKKGKKVDQLDDTN